MTAEQDKGPLGHEFQPYYMPVVDAWSDRCEDCGQPASAHKAEEQVPERRTIVHQGPLDANRRFYSSAPEPADKAGVSAEDRAREWLWQRFHFGKMDAPILGTDVDSLASLLRAAEAAARRDALEEAAKLVAGHLGMREVANDIRALCARKV